MAEPQKLSLKRIRQYFRDKKNSLLDEISVISYVTKAQPGPEGVDPRLVAHVDPKSHISEQYRSIRTNIASLSPEDPIRAFLITSSLRGEGKTVTASNLAMVFAQDVEKKTILIDADMRKPNVHRIFNINKNPGLSDILTGREDLEKLDAESVVRQARPGTPIIVITGAGDRVKKLARDFKADVVLVKPFTLQELYRLVEQFAGRTPKGPGNLGGLPESSR